MKTKFIDFDPTIIRIKQVLDRNQKPYLDGVRLTFIDPPINSETENGVSFLPAEHIEIYGLTRLEELAQAITEFCEEHVDFINTMKVEE